MFRATLFLTVKMWKQPTYLSANELIRTNKMWHVHAMECYSALKRKAILTHATAWTNLENMLSESANQKRPHMV